MLNNTYYQNNISKILLYFTHIQRTILVQLFTFTLNVSVIIITAATF